MRCFSVERFTGVVVVTILLGGCAGSVGPVPARMVSQAQQIAPELNGINGGKPVILLADLDSSVLIYPAQLQQKNPPLLGKITEGVSRSTGVATDASGNLYVANFTGVSASLDVYRRGAKYPFRSITKGLDMPGNLAVDGKGTIYVADEDAQHGHPALLVYLPGATAPSHVVDLPLTGYAASAGGVAFDGRGNVLEGMALPEKNQYHVFSVTPGSWNVADLNLQQLGGDAIATDGAGNIYAAESTGGIEFYPHGSSASTRFLSAPGAEFFGGITALKDGTVYAPSYNGTMFEFAPGATTPSNMFAITSGYAAAVERW